MSTGMKTQAEIEHLKSNWLGDPCWDIEDTEGFEAHYSELHNWRVQYEQDEAIKEQTRLINKSKVLGCSIELVGYIESLERCIARLAAQS